MNKSIEVKGLTKQYKEKTVVNDLNFSITKGKVFGLLGANGAGKTTTIECILGTKKADKGEIFVLENNMKKIKKSLFERIGVQFQDSHYQTQIKVCEICEETAAMYKKPQKYEELLQKFGIGDKIHSFVKDLSGGERQRLFVVLALIHNPEVVFLDELTTGLDTKARRDVWKIIAHMKEQGMTILLTSHFMDEVEALCDEILILKKGNTVFYGTISEAKEKSGCEKFEDAYLFFADDEDEIESEAE